MRSMILAVALIAAACSSSDKPGQGSNQIGGPTMCSLGQDCPVGQGCGSDGLCHEDGECTGDGSGQCATGELCYNAGNDSQDGICASARPSANPYCRADGNGACRYRCYADGTCFSGATCAADGFCHYDGECTDATTDCTPNHLCLPLFDYGINTCQEDPNPTCIDDGNGACRLACVGDDDCLGGGGCSADGFCHASNECDPAAPMCPPDQICYTNESFGGLCGPPRPM